MSNYRSHLANGYTARLQAVINRAVTLGYTLPSTAKLTAYNNLIKSMTADNQLSVCDEFHLFAFNDTGITDFDRINLMNPSGTLGSHNGGLTRQVTGIKGDGTSGYFGTGFNPSSGAHWTLNNAGRMMVVTVARTTGTPLDGNSNGTLNNGFTAFSSSNQRINSTNPLAVAFDTTGTGLKAIMRESSTVVRLASFIHDWRNSNGYVGYAIDKEFLEIMIALNYPLKLIVQRWFFTRLTFANIIRHKINKTFKNYKPLTLYRL